MGYFDATTLSLAIDEPLPGEPLPLPALTPHLADYFYMTRKGERVRTTLDPLLQEKVNEIINIHQEQLSANFIFNSACIVVDVKTGNVLAYTGNSNNPGNDEHGSDVDIIRSERSTGSILKPLLYAAMINSGELLPNSFVADIPTRFPGFSPVNFDKTFSGAVPASLALSQSLNIPAVKMLQKYDPQRFLKVLREAGFRSFDQPADHYGLSLILGGGETSLWELAGVYASLSRVLNTYNEEKIYRHSDYHQPVLIAGTDTEPVSDPESEPLLSASSIWLTYEALRKVNRPESETGWQYFASSPELAWKTGTSFGFRDAWAVGTTPGYVVAVWAGNADGEGRPGLTGITAAAPILFDIVSYMGTQAGFKMPEEELTSITVCSKSGFRAGPDCPETHEILSPETGLKSETCPYHRLIHTNKTFSFQVNTSCTSQAEIFNISWFILPPAMEYFYRKKHSDYRMLPPFAPGCTPDKVIPTHEFIYPSDGARIFIPRGATGELMRIIAEVAHRNPSRKIFWHLDGKYIYTTRSIHQAEIFASAGNHQLVAVDEDGNSVSCHFTVIGR
jgi:penicillin-binding protein 1C